MTTTTERSITAPRIAKLQAIMQQRDLAAIVVSSYHNVSYFGGTYIMSQIALPDRLAFLVAPKGEPPTLVVCGIETLQVKTQTDIDDVRDYVEFVDDPTEMAGRILEQRGVTRGTIGVDSRRLSMASSARLRNLLPGVNFVPVDDDIELAQSVKDRSEVAILEEAAQATLEASEETANELEAGATERDFATSVSLKMMQKGGTPLFLVFATGERTMQGHPESTDRQLTPGELWRIDYGGRFHQKMYSDVARTGVTGDPTPEQEATLTAVRACQDAGFRALEPGRPANEVFEAVKSEFKRQGLPFNMPHVGHGMGVAVHEYPILQPLCDIPLRVGMVINVEPMAIRADRKEAYHVEDLAEVTNEGARVLTKPQDRLLRVRA